MSWGDLTDSEWRILDPLLPDRGERGPAIPDKRRTVNGILWVLRTGAPWRDMPERYGNWNSVFIRFTRWSKLGVWDAAFETLASLGPAADTEHAIDFTIVRAHQHAAGVKGGIKIRKRSAARTAASGYDALMELHHDVNPDRLLGDKGYSDEIRNDLMDRGIEPVIPPRSKSAQTISPHRDPLQKNRPSLPLDAVYRSNKASGSKLSTRPSTTLADLLTPLRVANPFSAVRTSLRWWPSE